MVVLEAERHGLRDRFAGFVWEPCNRRMLAHGEAVALTPNVFDTMVLLGEHASHVVSSDERMMPRASNAASGA